MYQLLCDFRAFKKGEYVSKIEYNRFPDHIKRNCELVVEKSKQIVKPKKEPKVPITATFDILRDLKDDNFPVV